MRAGTYAPEANAVSIAGGCTVAQPPDQAATATTSASAEPRRDASVTARSYHVAVSRLVTGGTRWRKC